MKQLKNLESVKKALTSIAQQSTERSGMKVKCYLFDTQQIKSQEYIGLERDIIRKKFGGVDYSADYQKLMSLPQGKMNMIFKLVEPITLKGTKQVMLGTKSVSPQITNCTEIYIPQDIVNNEHAGLAFEETDEVEYDAQGQESPVIILDLGKCIIDIAAGRRDRRDNTKWLQAPRAFVTDISFRAMQIAGSLLARDERSRNAALDYVTDDQLVNL